MNGKLIIPVAVLTVLAIGSAGAQNAPRGGTALPSENPGSGITFGQNGNLSFLNGGGGGQGAGRVFLPGAPFGNSALGFTNQGFGNSNFNGFVNPGSNGFVDPTFANGFNNFGGFVDPSTGLIIPFGNGFNNQVGNGFNQFGNGFNNQFFDPTLGGFGGNAGFFPGYGGFPYGGGMTYGPTGWGESLDPARDLRRAMGTRSLIVPVLGVNVPAPPLNGRARLTGRTRVDLTPKTPEDLAARRLAPDQDEVAIQTGETETTAARGPVMRAPATREQVQLAARVEEIMEKRPMREGLVIRLNRETVDVSYECMGETRTEPFAAGEVFFFRTSGALATAATANGALQIGDRVLVACEEKQQPRQAVAGSRQEMHPGSGSMKTPAASGSSNTGRTGRAKRR